MLTKICNTISLLCVYAEANTFAKGNILLFSHSVDICLEQKFKENLLLVHWISYKTVLNKIWI